MKNADRCQNIAVKVRIRGFSWITITISNCPFIIVCMIWIQCQPVSCSVCGQSGLLLASCQARREIWDKPKKHIEGWNRLVTKKKQPLSDDEIIELAWCDKTSFDDIFFSTGLKEPEVIKLMRKNMKLGSFRLWRKRVSGRASKHRSRINDSW